MNSEKRYQIFISSTFADLEEERRMVMEAIISLNCFPAGMEMFPATDTEQLNYIKGVIDQSDYYVLILAGRYGSLAKDGISFTEKEYQYAKRKGIPILAFIRKNIELLPSKYVDENKGKLEKFKNKVKRGRMVRFWSDPMELKFLIIDSLRKAFDTHPRIGWIREESLLSNNISLNETFDSKCKLNYSTNKLITLNEFLNNEKVKQLLSSDRDLPIGYIINTNSIYGIDLSETYCYAILGKRRTGKTNALKVLISTACEKKDEVYVIELSKRTELRNSLSHSNINMVNDIHEVYNMFQHLIEIYVERNKSVIKYITNGYSNEKIFSLMQQYPRVHIFIDNLEILIQEIRSLNYDMYGPLTHLLTKGYLHNIFYFYVLDQRSTDDFNLRGDTLYKAFTDGAHGIRFGGEIAEDRILKFAPNYKLADKLVKPGIGYVKDYNMKSDSIFYGDNEFFVLLPLCQ